MRVPAVPEITDMESFTAQVQATRVALTNILLSRLDRTADVSQGLAIVYGAAYAAAQAFLAIKRDDVEPDDMKAAFLQASEEAWEIQLEAKRGHANDPGHAGDDIFQGRGRPLSFYDKGEEAWPPAWRLPEQDDDVDLFGKFAWLADDLVLRTAVNIWDNGLRCPGSLEGISGGIISAHARLVVGSGRCADITKAADAVRSAWIGMAEQAAKLGAQDAGTA